MLRLLRTLLPVLVSALHSRRDLVLENLAVRQQLSTLASRQRPFIRRSDRGLLGRSPPALVRVASRGLSASPGPVPPGGAVLQAALLCLPRFATLSAGWPSRTAGAQPESMASSFTSASTSRSGAPLATCDPLRADPVQPELDDVPEEPSQGHPKMAFVLNSLTVLVEPGSLARPCVVLQRWSSVGSLPSAVRGESSCSRTSPSGSSSPRWSVETGLASGSLIVSSGSPFAASGRGGQRSSSS